MNHKKAHKYGINDADYNVHHLDHSSGKAKRTWTCPYYSRWIDMLRRCYSDYFHKKQPSYVGCYVCEEWLLFSNFRSWMKNQDWKGKHLDKDLLIKGNKVYSPDTCIFISQTLNNFTNDHSLASGELPTGVNYHKGSGKIHARCGNPITGKREFLGCFDSKDIAHEAWRNRKHEIACELADMQSDNRLKESLRVRYLKAE